MGIAVFGPKQKIKTSAETNTTSQVSSLQIQKLNLFAPESIEYKYSPSYPRFCYLSQGYAIAAHVH